MIYPIYILAISTLFCNRFFY